MTESDTWSVVYANDLSLDFVLDEWHEVTDGITVYRVNEEAHANYLAKHLNETGFEIPYSDIGMPSETFQSTGEEA